MGSNSNPRHKVNDLFPIMSKHLDGKMNLAPYTFSDIVLLLTHVRLQSIPLRRDNCLLKLFSFLSNLSINEIVRAVSNLFEILYFSFSNLEGLNTANIFSNILTFIR